MWLPVLKPLMMGSTMRAAPSTMSSGGWKRCSTTLRAAISAAILVRHPSGVDAVHVDPVVVVVGGGRARHHVERRFRHVRVRMPRGLEVSVELPFDRRHIDDVLVAFGGAHHQRLQTRVEDERRDGVHELHLEQFDGRDLGQKQAPRVAIAQVDLLQILVEPALREQRASAPGAPRAGAAPARAAPRASARRRRPDA